MKEDDAIQVDAFELPASSFLSEETRAVLQAYQEQRAADAERLLKSCAPLEEAAARDVPEIRRCQARVFYQSPLYTVLRSRYAVDVESETIGGIETEVFRPRKGVLAKNQERVLVNLHGGGFMYGARTSSHMESVPIAALAQTKVISVDYRMAPEAQFPAAVEDAFAVYHGLLREHSPEHIGVFGCSAGGVLAAQLMAWITQAQLPVPGAVGMFCGAGVFWSAGDSGRTSEAISKYPFPWPPYEDPLFKAYFGETRVNDPLAFPGNSPDLLARFPPSLLITSTRDFAMSSVVKTHTELIKAGVNARLHVWEGLDHAFIYNSELPEAREAYQVIVDFFDEHLQ